MKYPTIFEVREPKYEQYRLIFNNGGDVLRDIKTRNYQSGIGSSIDEDLEGDFETVRDQLFGFERPMFDAMRLICEYAPFGDPDHILHDGQFFCNGYVEVEGHRLSSQITFHTEFMAFVDDSPTWIRLYELASRLGAVLLTWGVEMPHTDKMWKSVDLSAIDKNNSYNAYYGPDHGRLERQVALAYSFPIEQATVEAILSLRATWKQDQELNRLWDSYGVSVG